MHNEEKFSHQEFVKYPGIFLTRERRLRERIGFLRSIGRAQFNPKKPNFVSIDMIYSSGVDSNFCTTVARASVQEFNNYLKSL